VYIDAKQVDDHVWVSERSIGGERQVYKVRAPYVFYYETPDGDVETLTGAKTRRVRCMTRKELQKEVRDRRSNGISVFESDVNPAYRYLEEKYPDGAAPPLRITLYDIEVDKVDDLFARPSNPFAPIISITLYHKWSNQEITIGVPPPNMTMEQTLDLLNDGDHEDGYGVMNEENGYYLVKDERELLEVFLSCIEDSDILSGWNAEFYDLPYIIGRMRVIFGEENPRAIGLEQTFNPNEASMAWLEKLSLFPVMPDMRIVEDKYGSSETVFQIYGRKHLDYKALYEKFMAVQGQLHSYALDFILQHEIGENKVKFDGSIDQFYRREFRKFLIYNRQDVMGMSRIDDKRKLITLANRMAHKACVTLDKTTGSVAIIEQAILKVLHQDFKRVSFDRTEKPADKYVPGAFVIDPEGKLYGWGSSYDVDSLYPHIIMIQNISPETLVGQFDLSETMSVLEGIADDILQIPESIRKPDGSHREGRSEDTIKKAFSAAWQGFTGTLEYHAIIEETDKQLTLILVDGTTLTFPAREWKRILKEENWSLSANGTVFDLNREGIVAYCLDKWYKERVESKAKAGSYKKKAEAETDPEKKKEYANLAEYYDMEQNSTKLFLNSTYGAFLNRFFRFYDSRCGRSVTLSGRVITKHMARQACKELVGVYEFDDKALIYGDTDSCYVTLDWFMDTNQIEKTADNAVEIADTLGESLNASFKPFAMENFLIPEIRAKKLHAKREIVFDRALFKDKKKKYAVHVIDKEGKRIKPGDKDEVKITGLEIKRSDTPQYVQDFLKKCLDMVIKDGKGEKEVAEYVAIFREEFRKREPWQQGSPSRVSKVTEGTQLLADYREGLEQGEDAKKPTFHTARTAAINTNALIRENREKRWDYVRDGDKIEVLYLRQTDADEMNCVAIRVGETYVPDWFRALPFDGERHELKMIDDKLDNIFGVLGWNFEAQDHYGDEFFV